MPEPINIPLMNLGGITWSPTRRGEPITVGIPLPRSAVPSGSDLALAGPHGEAPIQLRALDKWPDGSIRWLLIDAAIDIEPGQPSDYTLHASPQAQDLVPTDLRVTRVSGGIDVSTGRATFAFRVGGSFPFSSVMVGDDRPLDDEGSGLRIECDGEVFHGRISTVDVSDEGPLRAELEVHGALGPSSPLQIFARVEVFAGTATIRIRTTLRNPRRAQHRSGQWPLGDRGSVLFRSSTLTLALGRPVDRVQGAAECGGELSDYALPFEIHQESSGGDHWNGPVHKNRHGDIPLRFRGYRLRTGDREVTANRASPIVLVETASARLSVAVPQFWQNFPQCVAVDGSAVQIGFFPPAHDVHELQGGEQKAHTVVLAFAEDAVSSPPLAWVHEPVMVYPSPDWCCRSEAMPFLVPESADPHAEYLALVNGALDPAIGFFAKRELADEYGWRNFGDLPADHESARQPPGHPLVSHYNNQYDAIAGFATHFLRTGDRRWWQLCDDLSRHVRDIDIYRTDLDKSAYNNGLFWHTNHYTDAGTSTHRTYPQGGHESGGPSAEHNYNIGLMWHFFMTGDRASREAAVTLADWVLSMDDGNLTPFRWLAGGATGLASATGSMTYHGPGRGGANSMLACLVAHQLTGGSAYLAKAEEIVKRCVHPAQDLAALNLLDVERRWYYTVFLQALGVYLHSKQTRQEFDEVFAYARASLLHYARWMLEHERPYLSQPQILEFPTETWAAQDMRKADVFQWAALHATETERQAFLERAAFFFQYSTTTLATFPGRVFTRPIVLMLSNGVRFAWLQNGLDAWSTPPGPTGVEPDHQPPGFEPQKVRAMRRARWLAAIVVVLTAGLVVLVLTR